MPKESKKIEFRNVCFSYKEGERLLTLKHGLNSPVTAEFEDDGLNLSGGEAQKVAISRIFYKDSFR